EAKEVMDLYRAALEGAARHRLMVDFHGANKPTGESRTWPNELNREAVSGMERRSMPAWSQHDTTIPFTRMLAGHLDFTPMLFGDQLDDPAAVRVDHSTVRRDDSLKVDLRAGGGFVARFA